ncbi:hypothetical protein N7G274_009000 [Stereocaulon virgatum]|uniref:Uncharacterized protein n=1 Tax=Stereocaulon virgatum TaxID=373712 RepID=A0ABR3ZZB5_9LECA
MCTQSSGQAPQASTPSRLSTLSSPNVDSLSVLEGGSGSTFQDYQAAREIANDAPAEEVMPAHDEPQYRKHKPRSSGGFLLQTPPATVPNTRHAIHTDSAISENARGKRKAEEGDIVILKRASARARHRQKPSLGSSPLATEVVNVQHTDDGEGFQEPNTKKRLSTRSTTGQTTRSGLTSNGTSTKSTSMVEDTKQQNRSGSIGLDTDPAQIVNLALNLSESRRRNFSIGGLLAPRETIGARSLASASLPSSALPISPAGGSLRQHLQQQRQVSRNGSPRSGRLGGKGVESPASQREEAGKRQSPLLPELQAGLNEDVVLHASDATLLRAEKARVTFELSYEYRRLLQYLPVLPVPSKSRSGTNKAVAKPQAYPAQGLGRVYNPLQYIRNRKLRIRERGPLDAEGEGWNNVENIRAWVDTVANSRKDGISRVDRRFPLPTFDKSSGGPPEINDLQAHDKSHHADPQAKKIGRPRNDWIVTPWDLLADANWIHQDDNVTRIEDAGGNKLVSSTESISDDLQRMSRESVRGPVHKPEGLLRHINSSPERLRASFESFRGNSKERNRRTREEHEPKSPISDDNSSLRRDRWPKKLVRSRSLSSSGESHSDNWRGHKRGRSHLGSREDLDRAALGKQMNEMLAKDAKDKPETVEDVEVASATQAALQLSQTKNGTANGQDSQIARRPSTPQRLKIDMPAKDRFPTPSRATYDEDRFQHHRTSSEDFGSTAPNSPTVARFVPSIAINLSPPASPPNSAVSPRKKLPSRIGSFRRSRSRSINKRAVSDNDAGVDSGTSTDISRHTTNESNLPSRLRRDLLGDPANGLLSPIKTDTQTNKYRPLEGKSIKSIKDANDSRFRGLFKGGRIAELVGNEVSRVGDMLWKKDNSNAGSYVNSSASSLVSEDSDVDDGDVSGLDNSPKDNLSRTTTNNDGMGKLSQTSTNSEKPKYYMDNLPSFRSPFSKDEQTPRPFKASTEHDHITRQQIIQRERGRSSRFDRLAPPKIDMRGISPSQSRSPSPDRLHLQLNYNNDPHQGSRSHSGQRVRSADRRLNAMLAIPGRVVGGPTSTGLSNLESRAQGSKERPGVKEKRQWSIADRGVSATQETITTRDIARVRALLLSSGIKANEIARRAEEIPEKPSLFLQDLTDMIQGPTPRVARSQELVVAARILVSHLESTTQELRDAAEEFSRKSVEKLHNEIKAIDERATHKMTPLVRASADDADTFSTELTTTHTLAVKQLNDSIDVILRRRRRRLRWIRRGGWAVLEWTLLGVMWMIWFLVVIVRLVRVVTGGFVGAVRWLFWL